MNQITAQPQTPNWHYKDTLGYVNYGYWLATFQHKFYVRTGMLLNFLSIFLGSAVIGSAAYSMPIVTVIIGILVTLVGAIQMVVPFTENAFKAKKAADDFLDFSVELPDLKENEAKSKLANLQKGGVSSYHPMEVLALNRCREREDVPERLVESFAAKVFKVFI